MISGGMRMKSVSRCLILLTALLSLGIPLCPAVNAQTAPEQVIAFADHLYGSGDYYRAITEYERFLFLYSTHEKAPQAGLRIALCYLLGKKPEAARNRLRNLTNRYSGREEGRQASWLLEESYRTEGQYVLALDQIDKYLMNYPHASNAVAARITRGICRLHEGDSASAKQAFSAVPADSPLRQAADELEKEVDQYGKIPRKSPAMAGALSTILPGAGQVYIGRPHDAILAFVLNGVLIWAAYESFDHDQNVTGGLITVVEASWYGGNIYNAVNGANKYNKREKERFFRNIEVRFGPMISGTGDPGVSGGAAWNF
jgi:hypothetical protein